VVAALEDYDSRQPTPTVFWFDIFSNNQDKGLNREFTWWLTVFREPIKKVKRTLLVLEWDDPKPLSRACVFGKWFPPSTPGQSSMS